jgi:nucleotide-binding universal stress UspA family protein
MAGHHVLVAVGPRDGARAEDLARTAANLAGDGGRVELLHVYDAEDADDLASMLDIDPREPEQLNRAVSHNAAADAVATAVRATGVDVTFRGAFGDPGPTVVEAAADASPDFLVIGGRKRSPTGKALFGSTAQRVLLAAPCPVVFVKGAVEERADAA